MVLDKSFTSGLKNLINISMPILSTLSRFLIGAAVSFITENDLSHSAVLTIIVLVAVKTCFSTPAVSSYNHMSVL